MNSSQTKRTTAPLGEKEKTTADPFASDIFADSKLKEDQPAESAPKIESRLPADWVWRLPKAARPAVDWTKLWQNLPTDFSVELPNLLAEALAENLNLTDKNLIEFLFFTKREISEQPEATVNSWWAMIGIEGNAAEFAVEIDESLAIWLVDALLGETISDRVRRRDLTPTEIAVLEFLAVNLTHEANGILRAPLFKLRSLSRNSPAWTAPINADDSFSLLVSTWQTVHGFQQSIVKIYLTPDALNALQTGENKLLTAAPRRAALRRSLENRVKDVRTRLFLGETQTTFQEIAGIETGDVILIENYDFAVNGNGLYGSAEIYLGDGEQVKIAGTFEPFETAPTDAAAETTTVETDKSMIRRVRSNHVLQLSILYFEELTDAQLLEKAMPEENFNFTDETTEESADLETSGDGVPLENLAVTLRVELEARRLSLAEVGNLRVNQIIQLGARATDPVNLLIDDKTVARGELVEVEDRLGVRIIQILR